MDIMDDIILFNAWCSPETTAVRARTSNNMESFGAIYVTRYKPHEYDGSLRFGMKLMSLSVWFHDFASQTRIYYLKALERDTQYPDNLREKEGKRNSCRGQPAS